MAAVGLVALAAAVYSARSAFVQADDDLRQARINNRLSTFADRSQQLAQSGTAASSGVVLSAQSELQAYLKENDEKSRRAASGTFGWLVGVDEAGVNTLRQKNLRQDLGQSLPSMVEALNKQAAELGKNNLSASLDELEKTLFAGRNGLNQEFLKLIADIRKIPLDEVKKEFRKVTEQAQRDAKIDREATAARAGQSRAVGAAGYIVRSLQEGRDENDIRDLNYRVLSGATSPLQLNLGADRLGQFGRTDKDYLATLGVLKAIGGEQGSLLYKTGEATAQVESLLPGILSQVVRTEGIKEQDYGSQARVLLTKALGGEPALKGNEQLQSVLQTVISELNAVIKDPGRLQKELTVDSTGLARRLVGPQAAVISQYGQPAVQLANENLNRDIAQRTDLEERRRRVDELNTRQDALGVQRLRAEAEIRDINTLAVPGSSLRRVPIEQLQADFLRNQERLTGEQGGRATDPDFIAQKLSQVEADKLVAARGLQGLGERTAGNSAQYDKVRDEFLKLDSASKKLNQALGNLADASSRNAAIQERLNELQKDRQGRLSYAEEYITSSPQGRMEMNRGALLLTQAFERGNLSGFTPDQQRAIVQSGRKMNYAIPALGGENGNTVVNRLLANTPELKGLIDGPAGEKNEVAALQTQLVENMKAAEQAVRLSATKQEENIKTLVENLDRQFKMFFERQEKSLGQGTLNDRKSRQTQLELEQNEKKQRMVTLKLLKSLGGGTEAEIKGISSEASSIETVIEQTKKLREYRKTFLDAESTVRGKLPDDLVKSFTGFSSTGDALSVDAQAELRKYIGSFVSMPPDSISRIVAATSSGFNNRAAATNSWGLPNMGFEAAGLTTTGRQRILREELLRSLQDELVGQKSGVSKTTREAIDKAKEQVGSTTFDLGKFRQLSEEQQKAIISLLKSNGNLSPDGVGTPSERAADKFKAVTDELGKLVKEIEALRKRFNPDHKASGGLIPYLSGGGFPFQPRGTDTVPAMLTPGEYVVNARSTKANLKLLEEINRSNKPVYLAEGGVLIGGFPYRQLQNLYLRHNNELMNIPRLWEQQGRFFGPDKPRHILPHDFWNKHRDEVVANRRAIVGRRQDVIVRRPEVGPPTLRQMAADEPFGEEAKQLYIEKLKMRLDNRESQLNANLEEARNRGFTRLGERFAANRFYDRKFRDLEADKKRLLNPERIDKAFNAFQNKFSMSVAASHELGGINTLRRRQLAARSGNALEYFGLGRADSSTPTGSTQQALSYRQSRLDEDFKFGFTPSDPAAFLRFLGVRSPRVPYYAEGGAVNGHSSGDSVLGWLTPGEHVLSRKAVDRLGGHGNIQRFASGGVVGNATNYLGIGGEAVAVSMGGGSGVSPQVMAGFEQMSRLAVSLNGFRDVSTAFTAAMNRFSTVAQELARAMSAFPAKLEVSGRQTVEVIFNGAEVFANITPEMKSMVEEKVKEVVNKVFRDYLPDAGVNLE